MSPRPARESFGRVWPRGWAGFDKSDEATKRRSDEGKDLRNTDATQRRSHRTASRPGPCRLPATKMLARGRVGTRERSADCAQVREIGGVWRRLTHSGRRL